MLNNRQLKILEILLDSGRINVREIARKLGSASRLKPNLQNLLTGCYVRREEKDNAHYYTITTKGIKEIAEAERSSLAKTIAILDKIRLGELEIKPPFEIHHDKDGQINAIYWDNPDTHRKQKVSGDVGSKEKR